MPRPRLAFSLALTVFGLVFIFGIPVLNRLWPSGWAWVPEQPAYLHMIWGIYVTLGVFLLLAARNPTQHLSLIWFTVCSSVAHAGVMAVHSVTDPGQIGHLWGDVAALLFTAAVLAVLTPRRSHAEHSLTEDSRLPPHTVALRMVRGNRPPAAYVG